MNTPSHQRPLPRELVLASAGSGKTYHLSSRIIGLLAAGAEPGDILASTFTRKAAGEILERVLVRLAEGASVPGAAEELGASAHPSLADPRQCKALLNRVLDTLHTVNVGTLDAFFVRVARTFFQELGLAPGWSVADTVAEDRLRTEAVLVALEGADRAQTAELLHLFHRGAAVRRVHEDLVGKLAELLRIRRQADPGWDGVWSPDFGIADPPSPDEVAAAAEDLARRLADLPVPSTQKGTPDKTWEKARDKAADRLRTRAWGSLFDGGIGGKLLQNEDTFQRHVIPGAFADLFLEAQQLGRRALAASLQRETEALGRIAALLEEAFTTVQRRKGSYRFEDITHLLGGPGAAGARSDLHYRLDQQVRHLLLDEFQDTSLEQWRALAPLADELLSGHREERAGVIVADPKQSIYGWRGARPELVHAVGHHYGLDQSTLDRSWRSSAVVLDFVARVFRSLPDNAVVQAIEGGPDVATAWMEDFTDLTAAKDRPGHVQLHLAPPTTGTGAIQVDILRHAAKVVHDLHRAAPQATIGVLVRRNKVLSYLMDELGALGVAASGEGGSPLTDTAPANAILSALLVADHPGDTRARYHVATTPLGAVVGLTSWRDPGAAHSLSGRVRRGLMRDGYGPTLAAWVTDLAPHCDQREVQRLLQLVELAHRWDQRATLRPGDFVRYVQREVVEDPSGARVQVMTVHKAKGLEFDAVVLPELYGSLASAREGVAVTRRDPATGLIAQVFPRLREGLRPYFPEIAAADAEAQATEFRDSLGVLYVALTRARQALHLVLPAEGGSRKDAAALIREALALVDPVDGDADLLLAEGDPQWYREHLGTDSGDEPRADPVPPPSAAEPLLSSPGTPKRNLARRSASSLEGGDRIDLAFLLRLDRSRARERGDVAHAWCEHLSWMDRGIPDDETLSRIARRSAPGMKEAEVGALASDFRRWLDSDEIRQALLRDRYPSGGGVTVRIENERPFARRVGEEIQEGFIDRLVLVERDGVVASAEVLDFKTDAIAHGDTATLEERAHHYGPQIRAYCDVVRDQYGLDGPAVRGCLLFLAAGRVVEVG